MQTSRSTLAWLAIVIACYGAAAAGEGEELPWLNVHMVPHTHDDVGWLKTVDQYYVGARNNIQWAGVRYILDTTIRALIEDRTRRFVYAEIAFFERWWVEQTDAMKVQVKKLVNDRQLEFANGGWCMNDEATVYYQSMIDQMTLGHRWLNDTFGIHPNVGWAVDPFGHSSQQASALADMGMDAFFMGRIDDADRARRKQDHDMEFVWRASTSLGEQTELLGAVSPEHYYPMPGFNFDSSSNDPPIQDRPDLEDYNVKERADLFAKIARRWASPYGGRDLMVTAGGDFQYSNAHIWFLNNEKLMKYFKEHPEYKLKVFYSTPTEYFDNRQNAGLKKPFTIKTDDFFPYSNNRGHAYWTGYFTSRPALKLFERTSNAHLQVCKQLSVLGDVGSGKAEKLRRAMAVVQHHDGVSGTEKQHVADDYALRLSEGNIECDGLINEALSKLSALSSHAGASLPQFQRCAALNVSICAETQRMPGEGDSSGFQVLAYNALALPRTEILRVPVDYPSWTVTDAAASPIVSEVVVNIADAAISKASSKYTLMFTVSVPPLGYSTYRVSAKRTQDNDNVLEFSDVDTSKDLVIENSKLKVVFASRSGRLFSVFHKEDSLHVQLDQAWMQYRSHTGNDGFSPSGAYIFRPQGEAEFLDAAGTGAVQSIKVARTRLGTVVYQQFSASVVQKVTLFKDAEFLDIEYTVGPIDVSDGIGKEVITRFRTDIDNNDIFFTDSNGREMMKRRRDFRPTWDLKRTEPIAENYYPVTSAAYIRDNKAHLTVLTDRSQGGGSINAKQIELMVHRRCLHDDNLGVGEPLNETGVDGRGLVIRGTHRIIVSGVNRALRLQRLLMERMAHPIAPKFVSGQASLKHLQRSFISEALPASLHLITLDRIDRHRVLLRIGHRFAIEEENHLSKPVSFSLASFFGTLGLSSVTELSLSANQPRQDMTRRHWNTNTSDDTSEIYQSDPPHPLYDTQFTVTLNPMQIKTWMVELASNSYGSHTIPVAMK